MTISISTHVSKKLSLSLCAFVLLISLSACAIVKIDGFEHADILANHRFRTNAKAEKRRCLAYLMKCIVLMQEVE